VSPASSLRSRAGPPAGSGSAVALIAAESCMRGQGIDIPDVTRASSAAAHAARLHTLASEPPVKLESAEKACEALITKALPQGNGLTPAELERHLRGLELFASCMQSRRIDYPDPPPLSSSPSAQLAYHQAVGSIDYNSPAVKSAAAACQKVQLKEDTGQWAHRLRRERSLRRAGVDGRHFGSRDEAASGRALQDSAESACLARGVGRARECRLFVDGAVGRLGHGSSYSVLSNHGRLSAGRRRRVEP
jgi:hypothetical protein